MIKLCFGSLVKALVKFSAPTTTQKELCGQLILSINGLYDITTDDTSASKLANGFQNVPKGITEAAKKCNPVDVLDQISKRVLPLLDSNKTDFIIMVLKRLLLDDIDIAHSTKIDVFENGTKEQIIRSDYIPCEKMITILLLYAVIYTKNGGMREAISKINDEYFSACIGGIKKYKIPPNDEMGAMDCHEVELTVTPFENMMAYLRCPADWESSESMIMDIRYYKYAPEYTIEHTYESEDGRDGLEYYLFSQRDPTPHWTDIRLKYHQTVLYHTQGVFLDGGRYYTSCPEWGFVHPFCGSNDAILYKYMVKGSCEKTIHDFYYNSADPEERYAHDRFIDCIILFSCEDEKERFGEFADYRWDEYNNEEMELNIPYIEANSEQTTRHFERMFRNVRLLQKMHSDFLLEEYTDRD